MRKLCIDHVRRRKRSVFLLFTVQLDKHLYYVISLSLTAIVVLGGRRRYILSHPNQCENLALLPKEHESARHSEIDYANPDVERFPEVANAKANEVVLEAGHVLYLPTHWFHYIVSLDLNFQCNTRSGITHDYHKFIKDCGF